MIKEKIRKILIIFFTTILFALFWVNKIFAISINLSDKLDIWPILWSWSFDWDENFNIDNQVLYSDVHRDYSNTTAFKCLEKNWAKCLLWTWSTTVFYLFDLNKEWSEKHSFSSFFDSSIWYSLVYNNDLQTRKIFLRIWNNNKELLDLTNLQSCWDDNPNLCLFAFNFSWFYLNKSWFSWVYLRLVDTYDYWDLSNVSMNRLFLDRTDSNKSEESIFSRFWRWYTEWFNWYDWWYWARISDLKNWVISLWKWYNWDNFYNYCITDDWYFNELVDNQAYYHCNHYRSGIFKGKVKMLTSIWWIEANILNYTDVVIRDFLAWNRDHLKRTIKDVIWDFKIKWIVSWTWSSSNPENWKEWTYSNKLNLLKCELIEIPCHMINFSKIMDNEFSKVFGDDWILWIIIKFFNSIINLIKDFFKFIFDVFSLLIKTIFDFFGQWEFPYLIEKRICDTKYNFDENILKSWNNILEPLSVKNLFSSRSKEFLSSYIDFSFVWQYMELIPNSLNNIISFFRVINPVPPTNWDFLCTYTWLKEINYNKNSFLDVIISMMFFFWIFFLFFKS